MLRSRNLRVELYGGLGNQVLIYLAGLSLAKDSLRRYKVDFFWCDKTHSKEFDLTSFKLDGKVCRRNLNPVTRRIIKFSWRIRDSLSYRIPLYRLLEDRLFGVFRESFSKFETSKVNLTELNLSRKKNLTLKGYFFSNYYFLQLQDINQFQLKLKWPSAEFLNLKNQMQKTRSIGIHLRKWENKNGFGQLSEEYFLLTLRRLQEESVDKNESIYIFVESKDDLNAFPQLASLASRILTPLDLRDPAETMLLISMCNKLIISNSTFSYCAALFSHKNAEVYAPWPFRPELSGISQEEVLLQHWVPIKSQWVT